VPDSYGDLISPREIATVLNRYKVVQTSSIVPSPRIISLLNKFQAKGHEPSAYRELTFVAVVNEL
jgi:hypothetical protein